MENKAHNRRNDGEPIILLHGLGRTYKIMDKLSAYSYRHGYLCCTFDYESRAFSIESLADQLYQQIQSFYNTEKPIHFVGHSLGAIIIRYLLEHQRPKNLGRIVALAPPNHGSEVADFLARFSWYRRAYGPAGIQLMHGKQGIIHHLKSRVDYPLGVIAGCRSVNWFFSRFILSNPNDGKVTVASTKIDGMADHLIVPVAHPLVPLDSNVIYQTIYFIVNGHFERPE